MNETFKAAAISSVVIFTIITYSLYANKYKTMPVTHVPVPSIGMSEEYEKYAKTFKTYTSKLGYSFQYPPHLFITENSETGSPERVFVLSSESTKDDIFGVVVSVSENRDNLSPEEWARGPYSGADLSKGYNIEDVAGQKAISLDNGTWVVVNTPNSKYRLSIALLPGKLEAGGLLFTEMGIILETLRFLEV